MAPVELALAQEPTTGFTMRDYQRDAVDKALAYLKQPRHRNGILILPTGSGKSIVIAREATRSPTPRLLPFKKGPFHMAVQAGVRVVPIVMRNCGEIMASHSMIIHPGTVDVAVLPPVPTDDWTKDNFDEKVAEVRQLYLDTLGDWPEE